MPEWTQADLERVCAAWQEVLRLRDWEIKIRFCAAFDIDRDSMGEIHFRLPKKAAAIRILKPDHFEPNEDFPQDIEKTIVHELLHLHYCDLTSDGFNLAEERAVNAISSGLVSLKRFF